MEVKVERDTLVKGAGLLLLGVGVAALGYAAYRQVKAKQERRC